MGMNYIIHSVGDVDNLGCPVGQIGRRQGQATVLQAKGAADLSGDAHIVRGVIAKGKSDTVGP